VIGGIAHVDVGRRHGERLQPRDLVPVAQRRAGRLNEHEALAAALAADGEFVLTDQLKAAFLGQSLGESAA
jgi:hypothetical protein